MNDSSKNVAAEPISNSLPRNRFYQTVWRWHFYAGLFVIPFMLILGTTGIIYLFKPQLDAVMYGNMMFVQPASQQLSYTEQVDSARAAYPESTVTKFIPSPSKNRTAEVIVSTEDKSLAVFVDPYVGQVLGVRDEERNLQAIARKIHGDLFIGRWGDYLIELAACWTLVLLISGAYLWFPRRNITLAGTLIPRLWSNNKRIFWRDLHAVPGVYGLLAIAFLVVTGLPWTGFWGDSFAQVWGRFPAQMWDDVPQSTVLTGALNQRGELFVPWAAEQMPIPVSTLPDSPPNKGQVQLTSADSIPDPTPEVFNNVVALALEVGAPPGFSVAFPEDETGVYTVSAFPNDPTQEVTMHMDRYSGELLANVGWNDYGVVPKVVELGISIHMGKYFGWVNQIAMLLASLVTILLSVTGAVMWWQRRPYGSGLAGAPPMPTHLRHRRIPLAMVAVLGVVFPLVGISLVTVLVLDYCLLSRIPILKRLVG
ncbi:MAG: PepSY domain-containing protein [Cyanobacteria bacterium J06597_1]